MPRPKPFRTWPILSPLSWIYGKVMIWRNRLFDSGKMEQRVFNVPIISVGNIAAGGTGKTPMSAYLLQMLCSSNIRPSLLSRGYGRCTKGYIESSLDSTAKQIGDEPLEIKHAFPSLPVCVCEDRCLGAERMLHSIKGIECIVLDDAYQHRHIARDLDILLTDYNRLYTRDRLLPAGLLREKASAANRAQIIIVTKCPKDLNQDDAHAVEQELHPTPQQHLFFSSIDYLPLPLNDLEHKKVLLLTGIANPQPLIEQYSERCAELKTMQFPDHHAFSAGDINKIAANAASCDIIITTAKDYSRLSTTLSKQIMQKLHVQHIAINILLGQQQDFDTLVINYIKQSNKL